MKNFLSVAFSFFLCLFTIATSVSAKNTGLLIKNNSLYYLIFYDGNTELGSCANGVYLLITTSSGYHQLRAKYSNKISYRIKPYLLEDMVGDEDYNIWTLGDEISTSNSEKDAEIWVENYSSGYIRFYIDDVELGYCTGHMSLITAINSGWHKVKMIFSDNTSMTISKFVKKQQEEDDPTYIVVTNKK